MLNANTIEKSKNINMLNANTTDNSRKTVASLCRNCDASSMAKKVFKNVYAKETGNAFVKANIHFRWGISKVFCNPFVIKTLLALTFVS